MPKSDFFDERRIGIQLWKKKKRTKSINQTVTNMLCIIPNNMRRSDSKLTRALGTDIEVTVDPNLIRP